MQLSRWLERHANYQRGNTVVQPATAESHVVEFRSNAAPNRTYKRTFRSDAKMQEFILEHRRVEVFSKKLRKWICVRKGDWTWFSCSCNNVVMEMH
jgi:hypothetical protein